MWAGVFGTMTEHWTFLPRLRSQSDFEVIFAKCNRDMDRLRRQQDRIHDLDDKLSVQREKWVDDQRRLYAAMGVRFPDVER